jgi:short-subunit dehydrogenase
MDLRDKHVVITGGSRGIGAALGREFVEARARVTLVARNDKPLKQAADKIGASAVSADVRDAPELLRRVEQIAPIDVLVNNAGIAPCGPFRDLTAAELHDVYTVNAIAPTELARQVLPGMLVRRSGRIVFVSSLSALITMPGLTAYSASKAAVSQLAEGLRQELRGTGVGITLVEIGTVDSDTYRKGREYPPTARAADRLLATRAVRLITEDEVATAVVKACRKDRYLVVLPRRLRGQATLSHVPQRIVNLLLR